MSDSLERACLRQMAHHGLFLPETDAQVAATDALVLRGLARPYTVTFADSTKTYFRITDAGWDELDSNPGRSRTKG